MSIVYLVIAALALLVAFDRLAPATAARCGLALERWRSGLREKQLAIPGFSIPYLDGGTGDALVLVHGFGADKDNFTRVARFLTPHYRVICLDLPGFGDATRSSAARYGIAEQVARLHEFLNALQLSRVHLGGSSMGGYIVAQFAATYPEMSASLWLLDPAGTAAAHSSEIMKTYRASGEIPLLVASAEDFPPMMHAAMSKPPFFPHSVITTLAKRAVADYPLHRQIMKDFLRESPLLEDQYRDLPTPALIVWGTEDKLLHPSGAATLHALFPKSSVRLMQGIGHLPMLEAPKAAAKDYLAFRSQLN